MSSSLDYHALLWQQLNEKFAAGNDQVFVMSMGEFLEYSDYLLAHGNEDVAAYKTFEFTNKCIGCGPNYNPNGQNISTLWDILLNQGKGPVAGPAEQPAFTEAKKALFKVWETGTPTDHYQNYLDAESAYLRKKIEIEKEYKKDGDKERWIADYDQEIKATSEYREFQRLDKIVAPKLEAIDAWTLGPLAGVMKPMKKEFEDNKREVYIGVHRHEYMHVSITPSNWFEWFNKAGALDDTGWTTIIADEKSFDETQDKKYKNLGGFVRAGYSFLGIKAGGKGSQEKSIATGDSRHIKISFKVRAAKINRPWVNSAALRFQKWKVPGLAPGAWSTGVLDSSNNGLFPLLTTQLIVAKDIKVTAAKFSQEVTDTLTKFDGKVGVGTIFGLFSFGVGIGGGKGSESQPFQFNQKENSITLEGAQVIGYTATLMPKYPV